MKIALFTLKKDLIHTISHSYACDSLMSAYVQMLHMYHLQK